MFAKNALQECVIGCQALRVHEFVWGVSLDFIPMEKRMNELVLITKVAMWSRRVFETCMSPNPKEVVRKWMAAHVYNIQPTQYMLETQVFVCMTCFFFNKILHINRFFILHLCSWWVSFLTNFLSLWKYVSQCIFYMLEIVKL